MLLWPNQNGFQTGRTTTSQILALTRIRSEDELGFQLHQRQSRRKGPVVVTDLDFADDIALLS
jgi:hypothetical protein